MTENMMVELVFFNLKITHFLKTACSLFCRSESTFSFGVQVTDEFCLHTLVKLHTYLSKLWTLLDNRSTVAS